MKIIISGGGTGGHIFPAVAIAKTILSRKPDAEILFVGAEGKMEMEKVPAAGFKIIGLPIVGLQRRLTLKNLVVPFKLVASMIKARRILSEFKPDIAIGVGGYASGPLLRAATGKKIKTLIQEQNSYPGITNKILSSKVDRICVAYEGLEKYFPKEKIVITGNPVRPEVTKLAGKRERALEQFHLDHSKKTILVIGGSLGARTINLAIRRWSEDLVKEGYQLIWQTGKPYSAKGKELAGGVEGVWVGDFIREMEYAFAAADIVISRAGAMAIAELCVVGKPAIFVPYPFAAEDHQTVNAKNLLAKHAGIMIRDEDAKEKLVAETIALVKNEALKNELSRHIAALGIRDADLVIARKILDISDRH